MIAVLVSTITFASTTLGGLFALKFKDRLHLIMGFAAGVVVAVVFFDVLPEAVGLSGANSVPLSHVMAGMAVGFLAFHTLERFVAFHSCQEEDCESPGHAVEEVGVAGAAGFSFHSFLDGVGIGLGFQASSELGVLVALAVIAHDFTDGLNTVTVLLSHNSTSRKAVGWLLVDATTPVLGAASVSLLRIPETVLVYTLAGFAGFLLYIGGSDLLPEAHRGNRSPWVVLTTLLGAALMVGVTSVLNA